MEEAIDLSYNFYWESICGTLPSWINLYTVLAPPAAPTSEGQVKEAVEDVRNIDLTVPDKLLLWAYALVSGQYCNISAVVKYCEEKKVRRKKGLPGTSQCISFTCFATVGIKYCDQYNRHRQGRRKCGPR